MLVVVGAYHAMCVEFPGGVDLTYGPVAVVGGIHVVLRELSGLGL